MSQVERFFVYGSLSKGMVHFDRIASFIKDIRPAWTLGHCYRLPVGYPVLLESDPYASEVSGDRISGSLVEMEGSDLVFKIFDEFHGHSPLNPEKSLFNKKTVQVGCEDGETHDATVYLLNPAKLPAHSCRIAGGDWMKSLQDAAPLPQTLSEKQMNYVRRLGSSTGREIVPIDLALYRELMKLELIVDKGRRLALTKLGKEVYRFL